MIDQYVYSRNDGASVVGPNAGSIGHGCIGHTDSLLGSELSELNILAKSSESVSVDGMSEELKSNYIVKWLKSGRLAVGCNTPLKAVRDHHIAHFYVLDRELALAALPCMEQCFALPFLTMDMNTVHQSVRPDGTMPEEVQRQVDHLRGLRAYASLEEAGAAKPAVIGLRETMEWFGMNPVRLCRALESLLDAVYFNERQLLISCDWARPGAFQAMATLIGWLYRLLPRHVGGLLSVAMPYTNQSGAGDYDMVMIPSVNVKDDRSGVFYRPCGGSWKSIASAFDYLYSDEGFIHNDSGKSEIYRNECTINLFLWQIAQRLPEGDMTLQQLSDIYARLDACLLPDTNDFEMVSLDAMDLLAHEVLADDIDWSQVGGEFPIDNETLLAWRHMLDQMPLRPECRREFEERLMVEVFQSVREKLEPFWCKELRSVLTGGRNTALAMELIAMTCVKLWPIGPKAAMGLCAEEFASSVPGEMTRNGSAMGLVWEKILLADREGRGSVWNAFGISCSEEAAARRRQELADDLILSSAGVRELMDHVRKFVSLFAPSNGHELLLKGTVEKSVNSWLNRGVLEGTCSDFAFLFELRDRQPGNNPWLHTWERSVAGQLIGWLEAGTPALYRNVTFNSLRNMQDTFRRLTGMESNQFCERAQRRMKQELRASLQNMMASPDLLQDVCWVLLERNIQSGRENKDLYSLACAKVLGINMERGTITLPLYVTREWLTDMYSKGCVQPEGAGRVLCGLVEQVQLGKLSRKDLERGHVHLRENEVHMIRDAVYQIFARGEWPLELKDLGVLINHTQNDGRIEDMMDILISKYHSEQILPIVTLLVERNRYHLLCPLLRKTAKAERMNQRLEEELLQQIMTLLKDAYDKELVPMEYRREVAYINDQLFLAGSDSLSGAKKAVLSVNRGKSHIPYHGKEPPARPRGGQDAFVRELSAEDPFRSGASAARTADRSDPFARGMSGSRGADPFARSAEEPRSRNAGDPFAEESDKSRSGRRESVRESVREADRSGGRHVAPKAKEGLGGFLDKLTGGKK